MATLSAVIGIGNPLRGDDGAGPWLAAQVGGRGVQQLTCELAPELLALDQVLFIDAAWGQRRPRLEPVPDGAELMAEPALALFSHGLSPLQLIGLCHQLYGAAPQAALLLLPGVAFGHGTAWSAELTRQLPAAQRLLHHWLAAHA